MICELRMMGWIAMTVGFLSPVLVHELLHNGYILPATSTPRHHLF